MCEYIPACADIPACSYVCSLPSLTDREHQQERKHSCLGNAPQSQIQLLSGLFLISSNDVFSRALISLWSHMFMQNTELPTTCSPHGTVTAPAANHPSHCPKLPNTKTSFEGKDNVCMCLLLLLVLTLTAALGTLPIPVPLLFLSQHPFPPLTSCSTTLGRL